MASNFCVASRRCGRGCGRWLQWASRCLPLRAGRRTRCSRQSQQKGPFRPQWPLASFLLLDAEFFPRSVRYCLEGKQQNPCVGEISLGNPVGQVHPTTTWECLELWLSWLRRHWSLCGIALRSASVGACHEVRSDHFQEHSQHPGHERSRPRRMFVPPAKPAPGHCRSIAVPISMWRTVQCDTGASNPPVVRCRAPPSPPAPHGPRANWRARINPQPSPSRYQRSRLLREPHRLCIEPRRRPMVFFSGAWLAF